MVARRGLCVVSGNHFIPAKLTTCLNGPKQGCHFVRIGVKTLGRELQERATARFGQFGAKGVVKGLASHIGPYLHAPLKRPILSSDIAVQTDPPHSTLASMALTPEQSSIEPKESALSASDFSQILKWSKDISEDINLSSGTCATLKSISHILILSFFSSSVATPN